MNKILFLYSSFGGALGHLKVAELFREFDPKIKTLNLGHPDHSLQNEDISLPGLKREELPYGKISALYEDPNFWKNWQAELLSYVLDQSISVLLFEFFPFGRPELRKPLEMFLEKLKSRNPDIKIYASMRDILGRDSSDKEYFEKHERRTNRLLDRYFEKVFIHADSSIAPDLGHKFSASFTSNVIYTGFLAPIVDIRSFDEPTRDILFTFGGGCEVKERGNEVEALAKELAKNKLKVSIVNGPFAKEDLECLANVRVLNSAENLVSELMDHKLIISYLGFSTFSEIISLGRPAIFIPKPDNHEQYLRMKYYTKRLSLQTFEERFLCDPFKIMSELSKRDISLGEPSNLDCDGLQNTLNEINSPPCK